MESVNNITSSASKNDILDPLSVIIKLYLYNSKPLGTKISVGNNKVDIQYSTYVQGIWRRYNGDSKNDINILVCPILYACVYYLKSSDQETRAIYLPIFNEALQALSNLKQTYANTAIIYNIEHLINIIQSHINNEVSTGIVNTDTPLYKIKENIYQHLNEVWTPSRKNVLFGFIKEITEVKNSALKQRLLDGLAVFMDCIDTLVSNVLLNNKCI